MARSAFTFCHLFALCSISLACSANKAPHGVGEGGSAGSTGIGGELPSSNPDCLEDCPPVSTGGATGFGELDEKGFKITEENARVVGYIPMYRRIDPAGFDFDTLTHLCLAFAHDQGGELGFDANATALEELIDAAHDKGVYVLASIAGAAGGQEVEDAIQPAVVDNYVSQLMKLLDDYDLDGIDVDIEGRHVAETYEPFVIKLSSALPEGKLLTAAVASWNGADFSDAALAEYDFINLMSYDHCGSWSSACEHSTFEDAVSELAYWENERGLGAGKVTLGVPFYGYCWGEACPSAALTYPDILSGYPEARDSDYLIGDGYTISLNGSKTIAEKTKLSKAHGGIMIWELGQDAKGDDSLFQVIAENL